MGAELYLKSQTPWKRTEKGITYVIKKKQYNLYKIIFC